MLKAIEMLNNFKGFYFKSDFEDGKSLPQSFDDNLEQFSGKL